MNYFDFMESNYAKSSIANQVKFNAWTNAEAKAAHTLIGAQRGFYTYIQYVLLMARFVAVKLGVVSAPTPADEIIKSYQEQKATEDKAKGSAKLKAVVQDHKPVS